MRTIVFVPVWAAVVGALCGASSAQAQTSVPGVPVATTSLQNPHAGVFSGYLLSAPLRLSLEASVIPKAGGFPNCASLKEDVGNTVGGIPVQHYGEWRLAPRLVLSVFTQLGCPIDGGIGGTLTYAVPIRSALQLVFSSGLYAAPGQLPLFFGPQASPSQFLGALRSAAVQGLRGDSPVKGATRVDLVWTEKDGNTRNLGVESLGTGTRGIRLGGGF
jgi:hypothetical protein